jgi:ribokinase
MSIGSKNTRNSVDIIVVGSINMDLVVRLPQIPVPGETVLGGVFKTYPGGKGANQAVAAARLGAHVTMIGGVGKDAFGDEMLKALSDENIDASLIMGFPDVATGVALIEVDNTGQNSIAVASGANYQIKTNDINNALGKIEKFDALIMPLEIPMEVIMIAAKIAHNQGACVIFNPAPAQILDKKLLEMVDVLIPNEHELSQITGIEIRSIEDTRFAAKQLMSDGLKNLVVTLGSNGAILFNNETTDGMLIPAHIAKAVDTTAAGDCFVGAIAVGICEGKSLQVAAEFASAAAAISVTREGAQPSLPYREEVEKLLLEKEKLI